MFALPRHLGEIRKSNKIFRKSYLENEGLSQEVEKLDLRHSTGNVQFYIDFFQIVAPDNILLCNRHYTRTHTHTRKRTARDRDVDYTKSLQSAKNICQ